MARGGTFIGGKVLWDEKRGDIFYFNEMRTSWYHIKFGFKLALFIGCVSGQPVPAGPAGENIIQFNSNGAWCWYQDERAIVADGRLLLGTVAGRPGVGGQTRSANVDLTLYDFKTQRSLGVVLGNITKDDDHNVPALMHRPDGRYLAVWARHHADRSMRWAISEPRNPLKWSKEKLTDVGANITYSNVFRLSAENGGKGRTYNFHRGRGFNPNCMISDDDGNTWVYGGRLMSGSGRPYVKYASNNRDVIWFANTEQHPRDYDNNIYAGYVKGGQIHDSHGNVLDKNLFDDSGPAPNAFTQVFKGDKNNVAWISDIHIDNAGNPWLAFSVQKNSAGLPVGQGGEDHRYHYAYFTNGRWSQYEIAFAGSRLYSREDDYTGNIALNPNDPGQVFISTDAHPKTGKPLISNNDKKRHYEIFDGITRDQGKTWDWTPITSNSNADNIRPMVPIWHKDSTAVIWMQGTYTTYTNFNTKVIGIVRMKSPPTTSTLRYKPLEPGKVSYFHKIYDLLGRKYHGK